MSINEYTLLNKETLEKCFKELANELRKRIKHSFSCELIIVGGASIVLNYNFRLSTMDIDCLDVNDVIMNDIVSPITQKFNIDPFWINTDFMNTKSYSPKIYQYASFYKSYGNGALVVRTIKDEYLLAMKVISGRKYKNDISDIFGTINYHYRNNDRITLKRLDDAIIKLYGSFDNVNEDIYKFAKSIIDNPTSISIDEINMIEENNRLLLLNKVTSKEDNESNLASTQEILKNISKISK